MLKFQNNNTTVIKTFEDFILTVYVVIDDLYHQFAPPEITSRRHIQDAKLSDPEIITISICGELAGVDSENAWFSFVKKNYRHLFHNLCSRSRFNRTRRALLQTTELLRQKMISVFPIPFSQYFVIDSFRLRSVNLEEHDTAALFAVMVRIMEDVLRKKKHILAIRFMP